MDMGRTCQHNDDNAIGALYRKHKRLYGDQKETIKIQLSVPDIHSITTTEIIYPIGNYEKDNKRK